MKHSEKLSRHRRNSNLLKDLEYDWKTYRPSPRICRQWFNILNQQMFGNKLPPVDELYVTFLWAEHGVYSFYREKDPLYPKTKIVIDETFRDKKTFVEVLAHEMIHHFQYIHYEPVGHGPSFEAWRDNFALKGLRLNRKY